MFTLLKNSATQEYIPFKAVDSSNRPAGKTGVTITLLISKDGGNWNAATGSVYEPTTANGAYWYSPSQADKNCDFAMVRYSGSGIDSDYFAFQTKDPQTATLDSIAAQVTTVDGIVDTVAADTATLKGYTDTLEAGQVNILSAIDDIGIGGIGGSGTVIVNHNYGGTDNLKIIDENSSPLDDAEILFYLASDYNAGHTSSGYVKGQSLSTVLGEFEWNCYLDPATYYMIVNKDGYEQVTPKEVIVT